MLSGKIVRKCLEGRAARKCLNEMKELGGNRAQ